MNRDAVGVQVHLEGPVGAKERGASSGRRTRAIGRWLFDHRADLLAALVYGCLAYLSFSALSEYANAHHLFPEPWGGYAFAVAIDGAVLYAFISFSRAPILASLLLTSGAVTSYGLQQWHAAKDLHPAVVAGVVPAAMVLVTFAWHRIRSFRPDWPIPVPQKPAPEEAAPPTAAPPGPVQPDQDRAERARLYAQVEKARQRAVEVGTKLVDFTMDDWREVLHAYSDACGYCGRENLPLSIEHWVPLSRGGQHVKSNVVPSCEPCNLSKGIKTDEEWQEYKEVMAQAAEAGTKIHRNGWTSRRSGKASQLDREDIARRVSANQSGRSMAIEFGLSQRRYREDLLPMIREIKRERQQLVPSKNGDAP